MSFKNHRLLDVPAIKAHDVEGQIPGILRFLVENRTTQLKPEQLSYLRSIQSHTGTPIYDLYTRILSDPVQWAQFLFLNLKDISDNMPTALLSPNMSINTFESDIDMPEDYRKCWINITQTLGRSSIPGDIVVSNIPELQSIVVRAFLCMTFFENENWLNQNLLSFIVESYTIATSAALSQAYNLDIGELLTVRTYIAHAYSLLCTPTVIKYDDQLEYSPLLHRCTFLGSLPDILGRLSEVSGAITGQTTIKMIATMLRESNMEKFKNIDTKTLYVLFTRGNSEIGVAEIAVEYPPYWVYLLLRLESGYKNFAMRNAFKSTNIKRRLEGFVDGLVTSPLKLKR